MLCCVLLCRQDGSSLVLARLQTSSGDAMYRSKKDRKEEIFVDGIATTEARLQPSKLQENCFARNDRNLHATRKEYTVTTETRLSLMILQESCCARNNINVCVNKKEK